MTGVQTCALPISIFKYFNSTAFVPRARGSQSDIFLTASCASSRSDSLTENPLSKYLSFKNQGRKKRRNKSYVVAKYDEENNFIKYYHSQQELLDDNLDVVSSSLYRTLSSPQHKLYKNYYWFYADDPEQPDKTKIIA